MLLSLKLSILASCLPIALGLPILSLHGSEPGTLLPRETSPGGPDATRICGTVEANTGLQLRLPDGFVPCRDDTTIAGRLKGYVRPSPQSGTLSQQQLSPVKNYRPNSKYEQAQCEHIIDLWVITQAMTESKICQIYHSLRSFLKSKAAKEGVELGNDIIEGLLPKLEPIRKLANSWQALAWLDHDTHEFKTFLIRYIYGNDQIKTEPWNWPDPKDPKMLLLARYMHDISDSGLELAGQIDAAAERAVLDAKEGLISAFQGPNAQYSKIGPDVLVYYERVAAKFVKRTLSNKWKEEISGPKWEATMKKLKIPDAQLGPVTTKLSTPVQQQNHASSSGTQPVLQGSGQGASSSGATTAGDAQTQSTKFKQVSLAAMWTKKGTPNQAKATTGNTQPVQPNAKASSSGTQSIQPNAKTSVDSAQPVLPNAKASTSGTQQVQSNAKASTSGTQPVPPNSRASTGGVQPVKPNANVLSSGAQPVAQSSAEGTKKSTALPGSSKDVLAEAQQVADSKRKRIISPTGGTEKPETNKVKKA